jgi:hypothetical protein
VAETDRLFSGAHHDSGEQKSRRAAHGENSVNIRQRRNDRDLVVNHCHVSQ